MGFDGPFAFPAKQGDYEKICSKCDARVIVTRSSKDKEIPIDPDTRIGHHFEEGKCDYKWTSNPQNTQAKRDKQTVIKDGRIDEIIVNQGYIIEGLNELMKKANIAPPRMESPPGEDVPF